MQIERFITAVDSWLVAISEAERAGDLCLRLDGGEHGDGFLAALNRCRDCAATVAELGPRLAAELAGAGQDAIGVLRAVNLAGEITERLPATAESAKWLRESWPDAKARLQAVAMGTPEGPAGRGTAADLIGMVSPDGAQVLLIAQDKARTAEERMRLIVAMDRRFRGWKSEDWAKLLDCTPQAIRKLGYWKDELRAPE